MEAIALILALLINNPDLGCHALPAYVQRLGGIDYQVLHWTCGRQNWQAFQRRCPGGEGYWSLPFFLEETNSRQAFYSNRFGELQPGLGAMLENAHVYCGS